MILHSAGTSAFEDALEATLQDLPRLTAKQLSSPPPFTGVARNAALVLRFDDLLAAGPDERRELADNVHLATGHPPTAHFLPRVFFDETHGYMLASDFHPTRVVIDLTVSAIELEP